MGFDREWTDIRNHLIVYYTINHLQFNEAHNVQCLFKPIPKCHLSDSGPKKGP